jgi:hypothetical protein
VGGGGRVGGKWKEAFKAACNLPHRLFGYAKEILNYNIQPPRRFPQKKRLQNPKPLCRSLRKIKVNSLRIMM